MKKNILLVAFIAVCFVLFLYMSANLSYQFRQDLDHIVKIEIIKKEATISGEIISIEVLKTLDVSEHKTFINDLKKVRGSRVGMDPPDGYGTHIIRITYQDGEIELIGPVNNGYISVDGIIHTDNFGMNEDQFYEFISGVLGEEVKNPRG